MDMYICTTTLPLLTMVTACVVYWFEKYIFCRNPDMQQFCLVPKVSTLRSSTIILYACDLQKQQAKLTVVHFAMIDNYMYLYKDDDNIHKYNVYACTCTCPCYMYTCMCCVGCSSAICGSDFSEQGSTWPQTNVPVPSSFRVGRLIWRQGNGWSQG